MWEEGSPRLRLASALARHAADRVLTAARRDAERTPSSPASPIVPSSVPIGPCSVRSAWPPAARRISAADARFGVLHLMMVHTSAAVNDKAAMTIRQTADGVHGVEEDVLL